MKSYLLLVFILFFSLSSFSQIGFESRTEIAKRKASKLKKKTQNKTTNGKKQVDKIDENQIKKEEKGTGKKVTLEKINQEKQKVVNYKEESNKVEKNEILIKNAVDSLPEAPKEKEIIVKEKLTEVIPNKSIDTFPVKKNPKPIIESIEQNLKTKDPLNDPSLFEDKKVTSAKKFISNHTLVNINKDWSTIARFKSGYGEILQFFPVEIVDLKTKENVKAIQLEMLVKPYFSYGSDHPSKNLSFESNAFIGLEEIDDFISFMEIYVIPNLEVNLKKQSKEFIFDAKEMTVMYSVNKFEKGKRRFTVMLKDVNGYSFWTESQVKKLPQLMEVLKSIK